MYHWTLQSAYSYTHLKLNILFFLIEAAEKAENRPSLFKTGQIVIWLQLEAESKKVGPLTWYRFLLSDNYPFQLSQNLKEVELETR